MDVFSRRECAAVLALVCWIPISIVGASLLGGPDLVAKAVQMDVAFAVATFILLLVANPPHYEPPPQAQQPSEPIVLYLLAHGAAAAA